MTASTLFLSHCDRCGELFPKHVTPICPACVEIVRYQLGLR